MEESEDESWQISYLDIITILLGFLIILLSVSKMSDNEVFSVSGLFKSDVEEARFITTPINKIRKQIELALIEEVADDQIEIKRDLNDLLIRLKSDNLYLSGSATIQAEALTLLNKIARALKNNAYNDFKIEVEGHTDDVPIHSAAYESNWELSTARATNLVKFLAGMGISKDRLKASGYADSRPIASNIDSNGKPIPENRAQNRRVTLRLFYSKPLQVADASGSEKEKNAVSSFDQQCRYSVQLGSFSSFGNAFRNASKSISSRSAGNTDLNLVYNGTHFSLRTSPDNNLLKTLDKAENLNTNWAGSANGIIHQCYDKSFIPSSIEYQIQLGAFRSVENARNYASSLENKYDIDMEVSSVSNGLYRVHTQPLQSLSETLKRSDFLERATGNKNLVNYKKLSGSNYSYDFQIQLGLFQSLEKAQELSNKILMLMGLKTNIIKAGKDAFILVSEQFSDWEGTLQSYTDLSNTSYDLQPVLYFIEQKAGA